MHTLQQVCTQMCRLMSKHLCNVHTWKFICIYTGAHNTCFIVWHTHLKSAHAPVHACLCNGAETSQPWKLLRTILSLVQASCRLLFATHPPAVSMQSVSRHFSLKKIIQICNSSWRGRHCIVAQASSDHPRIKWVLINIQSSKIITHEINSC